MNETEKNGDPRNRADTYKMRLIVVVFVNFGPSLVGKLQVAKMPP